MVVFEIGPSWILLALFRFWFASQTFIHTILQLAFGDYRIAETVYSLDIDLQH